MSHEDKLSPSTILGAWPAEELTPRGKAAFLLRLRRLPVGMGAKCRAIFEWEMLTHEKITPLERQQAVGYKLGGAAKSEKTASEVGAFKKELWNQQTKERLGIPRG